MPQLSIVTTCKGRLDHLKQTLPVMLHIPDCQVVVVDYDCPDGTANWVSANHPEVTIARVLDRPVFNISDARNIGAESATGEWLLFIDADVLLTPQILEMSRETIRPGVFFMPYPRPADLGGTVLVSRADFDRIGGYEVVFEGWGAEDVDFCARLEQIGSVMLAFAGPPFTSLKHDNGLRTQFYTNQDMDQNETINCIYYVVKLDLIRQAVELDLPARRAIYADVQAAIRTKSSSLFLSFRKQKILGTVLTTNLRYDLSYSD